MGKKILKTWVYSIIAEQVKDSLWPWDWNIPKQDSSTKAYHTVIAKNMQNGHSLPKGWINRKRPIQKEKVNAWCCILYIKTELNFIWYSYLNLDSKTIRIKKR